MHRFFILLIALFTGLNLFAANSSTKNEFYQKVFLLDLANGSISSFDHAFGEIGRERIIDGLTEAGYEGLILDLLLSNTNLEYNYYSHSYPLSDAFVAIGYPKYGTKDEITKEIAELTLANIDILYPLVLETLLIYEATPKKTPGYYLPQNISYQMVKAIKRIIRTKKLTLAQAHETYLIVKDYNAGKKPTSSSKKLSDDTLELLLKVYPKAKIGPIALTPLSPNYLEL